MLVTESLCTFPPPCLLIGSWRCCRKNYKCKSNNWIVINSNSSSANCCYHRRQLQIQKRARRPFLMVIIQHLSVMSDTRCYLDPLFSFFFWFFPAFSNHRIHKSLFKMETVQHLSVCHNRSCRTPGAIWIHFFLSFFYFFPCFWNIAYKNVCFKWGKSDICCFVGCRLSVISGTRCYLDPLFSFFFLYFFPRFRNIAHKNVYFKWNNPTFVAL